jgi:hypothetical protein
MKTSSIAIALAALLGLDASWSAARAQGTLGNGTTTTGAILIAGQQDTWTFDANLHDAFVVRVGEINAGSPFSPTVTLKGPGGNTLRFTSQGSEAEVADTATTSGTYTVVVRDASNNTGGYRITMAKTGEPVFTSPDDQVGSLANGAKYAGTIDIGDLDAWTVDATQGDAIVVRIGNNGPGSTLFPQLRVFSPNGGPVLVQSSLATGGSACEFTIRAKATGQYLVIASDVFTTGIGSHGEYHLTMAKTGSPVTVSPGDEGGPLENGATYPGTLEFGDLDVWTVDAADSDEVIVRDGEQFLNSSLAPGLRIFAPSGEEIAHSSGDSVNDIDFQAHATGQYLVIVSDASMQLFGSGGYRLTMAKTGSPVTTAPKGGPLANGARNSGTIPIGGLDAWTVDATNGDAIAVRIGKVGTPNTLTTEVRIYSPYGGANLAHDSEGAASEVSIRAKRTGRYLVIASDWVQFSGSGDYQLTMVKSVPPGTVSPVTVSPGDEGGLLATGFNRGTLEVGDLDAWTLTANVGDHLIVTMEELTGGNTFWPFLRIYRPDGVLYSGNGPSLVTLAPPTVTVAGTYVVVAGDLSGGLAGHGTYRIYVGATADAPGTPSRPAALALAPPAPNPFVARTVLHYALPRAAAVTLRIFDLQGRVVRTLADDATKPAGEYDATWDGRDAQGRAAGAGVYFARLTSDGRTEMREVLLTR